MGLLKQFVTGGVQRKLPSFKLGFVRDSYAQRSVVRLFLREVHRRPQHMSSPEPRRTLSIVRLHFYSFTLD